MNRLWYLTDRLLIWTISIAIDFNTIAPIFSILNIDYEPIKNRPRKHSFLLHDDAFLSFSLYCAKFTFCATCTMLPTCHNYAAYIKTSFFFHIFVYILFLDFYYLKKRCLRVHRRHSVLVLCQQLCRQKHNNHQLDFVHLYCRQI